jgi:hypothetical protein
MIIIWWIGVKRSGSWFKGGRRRVDQAGMGKTVLLAEAEREARSARTRMLSVADRESEKDLAFAGLHQTIGSINWHEVLSNALLCRLGP